MDFFVFVSFFLFFCIRPAISPVKYKGHPIEADIGYSENGQSSYQ